MRSLAISDAANDDLADIAEFIASESGSRATAERLVERIFERCERLASLPGTLGTSRGDIRADLRSVPEAGYVIFFRYFEDTAEIVHVLHGSRDFVRFYDTGDDR